MNNDLKGLCLFLGMIGLAYVALLLAFAALSGAKIIKSVMFIYVFSSGLITLGLTSQVKSRLVSYTKSLFTQ